MAKKKCKNCKKSFEQTYSTLQVCCSTKCAIEFSKAKKKEQAKSLNDAKIDIVSLPKELKKTQIIFNKWVRLRDRYKPCISENIPYQKDFDAGHYYSVKQFSGLRFNEDNVHGQSINGNRFKEGNFEMYTTNIVNRIGKERLDKLNELAVFYKSNPKKWTIPELKTIQRKYKLKIKELG